MSRELKMLRLMLLATGVLIAIDLSLGNLRCVITDIVLAMVLSQYYRYRRNIEHFVEAMKPLTFDGS